MISHLSKQNKTKKNCKRNHSSILHFNVLFYFEWKKICRKTLFDSIKKTTKLTWPVLLCSINHTHLKKCFKCYCGGKHHNTELDTHSVKMYAIYIIEQIANVKMVNNIVNHLSKVYQQASKQAKPDALLYVYCFDCYNNHLYACLHSIWFIVKVKKKKLESHCVCFCPRCDEERMRKIAPPTNPFPIYKFRFCNDTPFWWLFGWRFIATIIEDCLTLKHICANKKVFFLFVCSKHSFLFCAFLHQRLCR